MQSQYIGIKQAVKDGYIPMRLGGGTDLSYPTSKLRRGRVQDEGKVSPTITTSCGVCKVMSREQTENMLIATIKEESEKHTIDDFLYKDFGVFKLTPRECGRLMGVRDQDIDKMFSVNSNSQCYKQFGNSIVVPVLMAIFSQLHIKGVTPWNELSQEQREELIERTTI